VPEGFFQEAKLTLFPPEQIAPMVLRGVRNNRAIVFDHADQRRLFLETYQSLVMQAFDDVEEYERAAG
jgi:hypothetical protein